MTRFEVLHILAQGGALSAKQLAAMYGVSVPDAGVALRRAWAAGHVRRAWNRPAPGDRPAYLNEITNAGLKRYHYMVADGALDPEDDVIQHPPERTAFPALVRPPDLMHLR